MPEDYLKTAETAAVPVLAQVPGMPSLHLRAMMSRARNETGRSTVTILWRWLRRFAFGKQILLDEYFAYGLFDPSRFQGDADLDVLGNAQSQKINRVLNAGARSDRAYIQDKRLYAALLRGIGLPSPRAQMLVHRTMSAPECAVCNTPRAVARWLKSEARYPLFGKPLRSEGGVGAISIDCYDPGTRTLRLIGGQQIAPLALAREICAKHSDSGFLFLDRLRPHSDLRTLSGETLGCLRLVTLTQEGRAKVLYGIKKIPAVDAVSDNLWRSGNLLAHVDFDTGRITRVIHGRGFGRIDHTHHPDTGVALVGATIPLWREACELAVKAAEVTPGMGVLGWDIAVTDDSPVIIEANGNANHTMLQLVTDKGAFLPDLKMAYDEGRKTLRHRRTAKKRAHRSKMRALVGAYARRLRQDIWKKDLG